ncbi:MAG: biotin transporter BioY [Thermoplasmata archaeon]|nr:MAG: biotin transporter BioY [Thermoplasmata archaeon]
MTTYVSRYRDARQSFYQWRDETETLNRFMLAFVFACLTGLGAYLRVYTPLSPVPFTAQVFFVLLSGAVLGSRWGGASQMIYVLLGAVGVPWFAGGASGLEYVAGATGGYLVGFVLAAAFVGLMVERRTRDVVNLVPVMVAGVLIIYAIGASWLAVVLGLSAAEAIALGVAPFLLLDVVKSILAAGAARLVTTRA